MHWLADIRWPLSQNDLVVETQARAIEKEKAMNSSDINTCMEDDGCFPLKSKLVKVL